MAKGHSVILSEATPGQRKEFAARYNAAKGAAKVKCIQEFAAWYGSWGCEECERCYLPGEIEDDNACAAGRCTG